jgi:hypothetical protein
MPLESILTRCRTKIIIIAVALGTIIHFPSLSSLSDKKTPPDSDLSHNFTARYDGFIDGVLPEKCSLINKPHGAGLSPRVIVKLHK